MAELFSGRYRTGTGRRKTAVAQVRLYKGTGVVMVNDRTIDDYFGTTDLRDTVLKAMNVLSVGNAHNISIHVDGGGFRSQAEAARLGIARALLQENMEWRSTLKSSSLLTRDARKKERKKPGLKRARRAPQFAKR